MKALIVFIGRFFAKIIYPAKFYHKENLPKGKTLFVCNHFSNKDCFFFYYLYRKDIYFLSKKEASKNKLAGWFIKTLGGIPIDRDNPELKSMMQAMKVLKEDKKLVIFPEGTRNKVNDELQPIKSGAGIFAIKTKSPIVPIMILKKPRAFRKSRVMIGEPFELDAFYGKKITDEDTASIDSIIAEKMRETHAKLKAELKK